MRLFFAVELIGSIKEAIGEAERRIGIRDLPWRWIPPGNVHLTLKFLGETPETDVDALSECAVQACHGLIPFSIRLGGLGGFPNLSRPRVLFFKVDEGARSLTAMAERLDEVLAQRLEIPRETRPFQAHATVARIKTGIPPRIADALQAVPPLRDASQAVKAMSLMRSDLHPQGAKYHRLKEFALAKSE